MFNYLVAAEPERESAVVGKVLADASNIYVIEPGSLQRHRINQVGRVVLQRYTVGSGQSLASLNIFISSLV